MDASQYLRRRIASCAQTVSRTQQCMPASVRTDVLRMSANKTVTAVAAPSLCCESRSSSSSQDTTRIIPIPGAACACQDLYMRYTAPHVTMPAAPMLYAPPPVVGDCKVVPYVGPRAQHTEAVRLRNCADCTPPPKDGSYCFSRALASVLYMANKSDFNIGSAAFTIEWFQYLTPTTTVPTTRRNYVFAIGSPNAPDYARIGFSIERDPPIANGAYQVYLHAPNNKTYYFGNFGDGSNPTDNRPMSAIENAWAHFALCGYGNGEIQLFVNGAAFGSRLNTAVENAPYVTAGNVGAYNFSNTDYVRYPLVTVGNTHVPTDVNTFEGCITNFHWVHGAALYTGPFTVPTQRLIRTEGSRFLGIGYDYFIQDESRLPFTSGTFNLTNVSYSANTPFPP